MHSEHSFISFSDVVFSLPDIVSNKNQNIVIVFYFLFVCLFKTKLLQIYSSIVVPAI